MTVDIFSVSDQAVCISGASRGLGKGLARMFAEYGPHVVIASYDAAELAQAEAELAGNGPPAMTVGTDVSDAKSSASLVEQTLQKFGRIDAMVCNAGIDKIKATEAYEGDEWEQILDVNLKGAYFCAKA
jgi:NAD(P)-dependent dehydrogenase (short-subunit alcohol dehydrogenase family)